jgi:hypothetical protein
MIMISGHKGIDLLLPIRDFLYKPVLQDSFIVYIYLVNNKYTAVLVKNTSFQVISLPINMLVGHISDPEFYIITLVTKANIYYLTSIPAKKPL